MSIITIISYQMLLEHYLASRVLRKKSEDNYRFTIKKLESDLSAYCQQQDIVFDINANTLTQVLVLRWRKYELENDLAANSWNTYMRHLKALFNYGIDTGLLTMDKNPFNKTAIKPPKKRKKVLSSYQLTQTRLFLTEAREDDERGKNVGKLHPVWFWQTVFETFYYTGIRRNQLVHLKVGDIHLKNRLIHIRIEGSKTWREYEVPICDHLLPYLQVLLTKASLLGFKVSD